MDHESIEIGSRDWLEHMGRHDALRLAFQFALNEASERQAEQYDKHRRDLEYEVGQLVLVRNRELSKAQAYRTASLNKPFMGPWIIVEKLSPTVYRLTDLSGKDKGKLLITD